MGERATETATAAALHMQLNTSFSTAECFEINGTRIGGSIACELEAAEGPARLILVAAQSLIFSLAFLSNVVVLIVLFVCNRRKKLSRMYLFIAHLCFADVAVACFNVLPNLIQLANHMQWIVPGDFLCKSVHYGSVAVIYASAYVLVMTAVDRYIAICHPMVSQRATGFKKVHVMALIAWLTALIFSIPQLVIFRYSLIEEVGAHDCFAQFAQEPSLSQEYETAYTIWFAVAVWIAPVLVLAFCYVSITVIVWRNRDFVVKSKTAKDHGRLVKHRSEKSGKRGLSAATVKTVQLTLTVVACYIICWSPWMASMLFMSLSPPQGEEPSSIGVIAILLSYLIGINSCINPWIYFCFNLRRLRSARMLDRRESSCRTIGTNSAALTSQASYTDMQASLLSKLAVEATDSWCNTNVREGSPISPVDTTLC